MTTANFPPLPDLPAPDQGDGYSRVAMTRYGMAFRSETQRSSSGARSDETNPGIKERPEPALTDEQIDKIANSVSEETHSEWHPHDEREWRLTFARAIERAALSHRSTEEPADPEGARDRHAAAAAALLGPGYRLKGGE